MIVGEMREVLRGLPSDYKIVFIDGHNLETTDIRVGEIDEREVRLTDA